MEVQYFLMALRASCYAQLTGFGLSQPSRRELGGKVAVLMTASHEDSAVSLDNWVGSGFTQRSMKL